MTSAGEEVFFKIKRNTKLSKLQGAYASKVGKDVGSIRYVQLSARIRDARERIPGGSDGLPVGP